MWVFVGVGGLCIVLGLLILAFPDRVIAFDKRHRSPRTERARKPVPARFWEARLPGQIKFAGLAGLFVGVLMIITGLTSLPPAH